MDQDTLLRLLEDVQKGLLSPETASAKLARLPFESTSASPNSRPPPTSSHFWHCREAGTRFWQDPATNARFRAHGSRNGVDALATRADATTFSAVQQHAPQHSIFRAPRVIALRQKTKPIAANQSRIAVVCAGTSDIPVAEEAAVTIDVFGGEVDRVYDVGVAGLHRLLAHRETLQQARVIIVCAGMEGALPSVLGGLVSVPVIAVPTSVGYGASFQGLAALLGMLNSCSPNVTVVNIDNGFGAAYVATMICRGPVR